MILFVTMLILLIIREDVIVENLNEKICELYNQELADLMIGYNFNTARLSQILDMIATVTRTLPHITELDVNND